MRLTLQTKTFEIRDEKGQLFSLEEAKELYEAGAIEDYDFAFSRLVACNFKIDLVKGIYRGW